MTPKELHEKTTEHLGLMSWQLTNRNAHSSCKNRSARQPVATWNHSSPMQEPTSSSIAHMQRRGTGSKTPIFWEKGEAVALLQNHRPAGVGTDLWFPLTHAFSSKTQSRVPSNRPYSGVFCRSP